MEQPGFTTAKELVRFSPRSITLAPGKSQRVKLLRRVSADTPPGEYTGYIVFTQIPDEKPLQKASSSAAPGMRIELTAIPSFSIPVILTHGETKPDVPELSFLGLQTPEPGKPLAEKKPLLRHIASDYVLEDNKIWPKYREPFNIFAEGNKKCLEIKGKIPKSSKHLIWGQVKKTLLTECTEELARMTTSLNLVESFFAEGVLL